MSKIALVTGATSGIGEQVVRVFAEHGWRVMATGRNQARSDKLVAERGADLCAFRAADLCETGVADSLVEGHCHGNWMSSAWLKQYHPEMNEISDRHHRFPAAIIQHAVWLYFRFTLSYRDVEDLLAERGIAVSYEAVRRWASKFGQAYADRFRKARLRVDDRWHLDEVFI